MNTDGKSEATEAIRKPPNGVLVLLAALLLTVAFRIGFILFVCLFFGPHAYFHDGLRLVSYHPLILSDGRQLSRGYRVPVFLIILGCWLLLVLPLWSVICAFYSRYMIVPPVKGQFGTLYYYSALRVYTESGRVQRAKTRGIVEAESEEKAKAILQSAHLWCPYVREAKRAEVRSGRLPLLKVPGEQSLDGSQIRPGDIWAEGTP